MKKEDFLKKVKNIHSDKYIYPNLPENINENKIIIICPEHGEFLQNPYKHLYGQGCPLCKHTYSNKEEFIEYARKVHGDKYDYSKVDYKDSKTKVCIIHPQFGEFWQTPASHVSGHGYKFKPENNKEFFLKKAKEIHGDKYDYSKVEYVNTNTKVCIICPEHGEFWQIPYSHLKGNGCPKCCKTKKLTTEEFIEKAREIHGDKYDYSKVEYINNQTPVCIICPEHGEFNQTPNKHLSGHGCSICNLNKRNVKNRLTTEEFIERARKIHGDKYDYSKVDYNGYEKYVEIGCPIHGFYKQTPDSHLHSDGCPKCGVTFSKNEEEIYVFLTDIFGKEKVFERNRTIIKPYELDIYIPSIKIGIEYNGLYWHSDKYKSDKNYHLKKLNACKQNNIKLLQIFEDEYVNNRDIVYEKIKHILKLDSDLPKVMGRKCTIKTVTGNIAKEFLTKYHIQGYVASTIYLGAYYNDELIAVMSFKQEQNKTHWELTRFASNYNYVCQGIGGKLFKYFVRNYNPKEIKSFADRRWTIDEENNIYLQLGFRFDSYTPPEYRYFKASDGIIRQHKFNFRKQRHNKKYGLPLTMTEREMTDELGYSRIYDCGLIKYVWKKEE